MRSKDRALARQLYTGLREFERRTHPLPGIQDDAARSTFVEQMLESVHRVEYVRIMRTRDISPLRADATSPLFDPLKAAELQRQKGNLDEAFWLIFLSVHFGKHGRLGWSRVRDVYGAFHAPAYWTWQRTGADPEAFRRWLADNRNAIGGRFGNHRKYQSLDAWSPTGTGAAVSSYINWVHPPRTHQMLFDEQIENAGGDARRAFDGLYHSMTHVLSFGRMARFDYLTMIGKFELADIQPGSTYMDGATGPFTGAQILLEANAARRLNRRQLDALLVQLADTLGVNMQMVEDAVCNWQKSPNRFQPFRG